MDLAGERESSRRFHDWCARAVNQRRAVVERAIEKADRGEPLAETDYLHTRYTLEGREGDDAAWPNFQLDGLGTWLWALAEHARLAGLRTLPPAWQEATTLTARYLAALWPRPCYDCWEEFEDRVHPYTLAAIYGGLQALASLGLEGEWGAAPAAIRAYVLDQGVQDGRLVKSIGNPAVDASLLGMATPYRLLEPGDLPMQTTVSRIEADLRREGGGVHRYAADTYYGGGEWVLLTSWLGWYYADEVMVAVFEAYFNAVDGRPNTRGGDYRINLLPTTCHVYFGSVIGATPDGRLANKPLSEGISPVQGADRRGPTAVVKSVAKMDHVLTGGTLLNQKFTPQLLASDDSLDKLVRLIRTYFNLDGHHIQFNVVDGATLRAAQERPEQYRDLIVRVAGYSDYFCDLSEALQEEIIARTEHQSF
ncbi:MAG TPA: hypothetical protein ENN19_12890 [Chloroflexi bacterium]|nr:hypothetical protein [Chloroflexota bacterium]